MQEARIQPVNEASCALAARIIREGGVIVLPTDTVYGVACDPTNERAIERLYALKHRERAKALQVLVASLEDLHELHLTLPHPLEVLAQALLPGAFSPIAVAADDMLKTVRHEASCELPRETQRETQPEIPRETLHETQQAPSLTPSPAALPTPPVSAPPVAVPHLTQAIRIPDSAACLSIVRATGPLAASSANRSGSQSAQTVQEAYAALGDGVDLYLDAGPTLSHVASTVVAVAPQELYGVRVLREGVIPVSRIVAIIEQARRDDAHNDAHDNAHDEAHDGTHTATDETQSPSHHGAAA